MPWVRWCGVMLVLGASLACTPQLRLSRPVVTPDAVTYQAVQVRTSPPLRQASEAGMLLLVRCLPGAPTCEVVALVTWASPTVLATLFGSGRGLRAWMWPITLPLDGYKEE